MRGFDLIKRAIYKKCPWISLSAQIKGLANGRGKQPGQCGLRDLGVACFKILRNVQKACPQAFPDGLPRQETVFRAILGAQGHIFRARQGRMPGHHRPQWRRQVNPSANYFRHSRAVIWHNLDQRPRGSPAGAGQRLQSRIHGPRKRAAQCRDPGPGPERNRRKIRFHRRLCRYRRFY